MLPRKLRWPTQASGGNRSVGVVGFVGAEDVDVGDDDALLCLGGDVCAPEHEGLLCAKCARSGAVQLGLACGGVPPSLLIASAKSRRGRLAHEQSQRLGEDHSRAVVGLSSPLPSLRTARWGLEAVSLICPSLHTYPPLLSHTLHPPPAPAASDAHFAWLALAALAPISLAFVVAFAGTFPLTPPTPSVRLPSPDATTATPATSLMGDPTAYLPTLPSSPSPPTYPPASPTASSSGRPLLLVASTSVQSLPEHADKASSPFSGPPVHSGVPPHAAAPAATASAVPSIPRGRLCARFVLPRVALLCVDAAQLLACTSTTRAALVPGAWMPFCDLAHVAAAVHAGSPDSLLPTWLGAPDTAAAPSWQPVVGVLSPVAAAVATAVLAGAVLPVLAWLASPRHIQRRREPGDRRGAGWPLAGVRWGAKSYSGQRGVIGAGRPRNEGGEGRGGTDSGGEDGGTDDGYVLLSIKGSDGGSASFNSSDSSTIELVDRGMGTQQSVRQGVGQRDGHHRVGVGLGQVLRWWTSLMATAAYCALVPAALEGAKAFAAVTAAPGRLQLLAFPWLAYNPSQAPTYPASSALTLGTLCVLAGCWMVTLCRRRATPAQRSRTHTGRPTRASRAERVALAWRRWVIGWPEPQDDGGATGQQLDVGGSASPPPRPPPPVPPPPRDEQELVSVRVLLSAPADTTAECVDLTIAHSAPLSALPPPPSAPAAACPVSAALLPPLPSPMPPFLLPLDHALAARRLLVGAASLTSASFAPEWAVWAPFGTVVIALATLVGHGLWRDAYHATRTRQARRAAAHEAAAATTTTACTSSETLSAPTAGALADEGPASNPSLATSPKACTLSSESSGHPPANSAATQQYPPCALDDEAAAAWCLRCLSRALTASFVFELVVVVLRCSVEAFSMLPSVQGGTAPANRAIALSIAGVLMVLSYVPAIAIFAVAVTAVALVVVGRNER